jgi:hypothetical protein
MSKMKEHMFDVIEGADQALADGASTIEEIMVHMSANGVKSITHDREFVEGYIGEVLG